MALRIAIGAATEPQSDAEKAKLILATLPWMVWEDDLPEVVIIDQDGAEITRCQPIPPLKENSSFLNSLKETVQKRGEAMSARLKFAFDGQHQEVEDADGVFALSWPGLMSTLNTVAQPTPSALKTTWFVTVDRDRVAEKNAADEWVLKPGISAVPAKVIDSTYASTSVVAGSPVLLHTYSTSDVTAHSQVLVLEQALAHGVDELDNYWLSIRDSRDDSLLDLANRLEGSLRPGAMLSALSIEEWAAACDHREGTPPFRVATVDEALAVMKLWKSKAEPTTREEPAADRTLAERRKAIIREALLSDDDLVEAIREGYLKQANGTLNSLMDVPSPTRVRSESRRDVLTRLRDRLLPAFSRRSPSPCQPDEGIELVVGDDVMRLRHEMQTTNAAVDDVAAIQFFGRRSTDVSVLDDAVAAPTAEWHALSGARYALPDVGVTKPTAFSTDRVLGVTAGYVDEVLYRELTYGGTNLVCRNPLDGVHREKLQDREIGSMLADLQRITSPEWSLRALPLRYGDHYEFAASVVDRAGGMASELCIADEPWSFDPTSIERLDPPQRTRVHFLRRVAVGHCNVLPPEDAWPQTPDEVWLRCLEEAPSPPENVGRPTSLLLVPADSRAFSSRKPSQGAAWSDAVSFGVEAPRIDEHTLMRWGMPATTATEAEQKNAADKLKKTLTEIYTVRDHLMATDKEMRSPTLPYDPAVTAIGIRYKFADGVEKQKVFSKQAISITVVCGSVNDPIETPEGMRFVVAPGSYVRLGFVPLIAPDDFERMDADALSGLLEHQPQYSPWPAANNKQYGAFAESVVFAESASAELPTLSAEDLSLSANDAGDVEVKYAFSHLDAKGQQLLLNAHQMRISCERWTWRNLPIRAQNPVDFKTNPEEWRRRLASGPPREIMDVGQRDAPNSELVSYFDKLASVDQGFLNREEVILRLPRDHKDAIALHVDSRDGINAADYLRYRFSLRSRYRGVLVNKEGDAVGPRRIAVPFRGNPSRIKPPKLLAVLPMTSAMSSSPRNTDRSDGSAFLVVLDEPWFREYGMGERLRARVAHVKAEVGETSEPPELRYGPLPDHSVEPVKSAALDAALQRDLDCFGPFGFSLDRGGSQALANATGFVVYPPPGTPPHYNLFAEFSRLLDIPSSAQMPGGAVVPLESVPIDAIPLYTLPDSDALNPRRDVLEIDRHSTGSLSYDVKDVTCAPFTGAAGVVLLQYRYLLIVGRRVLDSGRGVDVFLPTDGLWMESGDLRLLGGAARDISGCNAAVIGEVLLNGRPGKHDPLNSTNNLREFFLMMFGATDKDAPGMIRRFSQVFDIRFS